jgi:DNA-binding CsgD family transcriptional regulator
MRPSTAASTRTEVQRICRALDDPVALHRAVVERLHDAVAIDRWCGVILDPATLLVTGGYHEEGVPLDRMPRLLEVECHDNDINQLPALAKTVTGVSTLHRASHGNPWQSTRYVDVLEPSGLGRELRVVLRDRTSTWGGLILLRETSAPDFSDDEMRLMADIAGDVGRAIRRALLLSDIRRGDALDTPGIAVLRDADDMAPEILSASARSWFADIDDGHLSGANVPYVVVTLALRARLHPSGPVLTRLRTRSGRWLTLHAEALDADRVSVIVEPTRPFELAAVICDAYGLTPREREVARLAVAGHANKDIAQMLWLSQWTVQDHLKKVFEKLAVHSRAELVARLFFDQYLPRATAGTPIGENGWFITTHTTNAPREESKRA